MEIRGRCLAPALGGLVAGCALQLQQSHLCPTWFYALLLFSTMLGAFAVFRWTSDGGFKFAPVAAAVLAICAGFGWAGSYARHEAAQAIAPQLEGADVSVTGVVAAMPQRNEQGVRFRFDIDHPPFGMPHHVQLNWYTHRRWQIVPMPQAHIQMANELSAGQRWAFSIRLKAPHGNFNPNGFDQELSMWEQGLGASGYVRDSLIDPPRRVADTWRYPVEQWRGALRERIFESIEDRRVAGIVAALTLGDQNAIERADWDVFRQTGVAHVMSISGLHITMFAWLASLLVAAFWKRSARWGWRLCLLIPAPVASLILGVSLAALYAIFSGWGVPARRTICMLAVVTLLKLSARSWSWPLVCLAAMCAVVVSDPWALMQAGFWLSFVAVTILFSSGRGEPAVSQNLWGKAKLHLREQWIVTVALTPLGVLLFQQLSVVGLPANLIAVPWVTILVTPLAMAGAFFSPIWNLAGYSISALTWFLDAIAAFPLANLPLPATPLWAGVPAIFGGALLVMKLPRPIRAMGIPLLLPLVLWKAPSPAFAQFELLAADIGQGNGVVVRTANHALVYDTGPKFGLDADAGNRVLVPLLASVGVVPDMLVLSHRDSDHVGGAASVMWAFPQATVLSSIEDQHELQRQHPAVRCAAGQHWTWDGVTFEMLHPQAAVYPKGQLDVSLLPKPNGLSCVLRISNGDRTALLVGDIEKPQEEALGESSNAKLLKADVLLVPHHGSKTSSSQPFIAAVKPQFALVQAGYRNTFGHPAIPVVERYVEANSTVVNTAKCGAAHWSSANPASMTCERKLRARYWHHGNHY